MPADQNCPPKARRIKLIRPPRLAGDTDLTKGCPVVDTNNQCHTSQSHTSAVVPGTTNEVSDFTDVSCDTNVECKAHHVVITNDLPSNAVDTVICIINDRFGGAANAEVCDLVSPDYYQLDHRVKKEDHVVQNIGNDNIGAHECEENDCAGVDHDSIGSSAKTDVYANISNHLQDFLLQKLQAIECERNVSGGDEAMPIHSESEHSQTHAKRSHKRRHSSLTDCDKSDLRTLDHEQEVRSKHSYRHMKTKDSKKDEGRVCSKHSHPKRHRSRTDDAHSHSVHSRSSSDHGSTKHSSSGRSLSEKLLCMAGYGEPQFVRTSDDRMDISANILCGGLGVYSRASYSSTTGMSFQNNVMNSAHEMYIGNGVECGRFEDGLRMNQYHQRSSLSDCNFAEGNTNSDRDDIDGYENCCTPKKRKKKSERRGSGKTGKSVVDLSDRSKRKKKSRSSHEKSEHTKTSLDNDKRSGRSKKHRKSEEKHKHDKYANSSCKAERVKKHKNHVKDSNQVRKRHKHGHSKGMICSAAMSKDISPLTDVHVAEKKICSDNASRIEKSTATDTDSLQYPKGSDTTRTFVGVQPSPTAEVTNFLPMKIDQDDHDEDDLVSKIMRQNLASKKDDTLVECENTKALSLKTSKQKSQIFRRKLILTRRIPTLQVSVVRPDVSPALNAIAENVKDDTLVAETHPENPALNAMGDGVAVLNMHNGSEVECSTDKPASETAQQSLCDANGSGDISQNPEIPDEGKSIDMLSVKDGTKAVNMDAEELSSCDDEKSTAIVIKQIILTVLNDVEKLVGTYSDNMPVAHIDQNSEATVCNSENVLSSEDGKQVDMHKPLETIDGTSVSTDPEDILQKRSDSSSTGGMGPPLALPPPAAFKKPLPVGKFGFKITDISMAFISSGMKTAKKDLQVLREEGELSDSDESDSDSDDNLDVTFDSQDMEMADPEAAGNITDSDGEIPDPQPELEKDRDKKRRSRSSSSKRKHGEKKSKKDKKHKKSKSKDGSRKSSKSKSKGKSKGMSMSRKLTMRAVSRSRSRSYSVMRTFDEARGVWRMKRPDQIKARLEARKRLLACKDLRIQIDKARLREIAMMNAYKSMKSGTGPKVALRMTDITRLIAGGKTVEELTDFCKSMVRTGETSDSDSDDENAHRWQRPPPSDDESDDAFLLKARHLEGGRADANIILKIRNAKQLPIMSKEEKAVQAAVLRFSFPVSSGMQHRARESEWVPVEKPTPSSVPVDDKPKPEVTHGVNVRNVGQIVTERLNAIRQLTVNPNDTDALTAAQQAELKLRQWAESKRQPGALPTGARVRMPKQLVKPVVFSAKSTVPRPVFPVPSSSGEVQQPGSKLTNSCIGKLLLHKMGWKDGEGLGKDNAGPTTPLLIDMKKDRKGLAWSDPVARLSARVPRVPSEAIPHGFRDLGGMHPVSALNELCYRKRWMNPKYELVESSGPAHRKNFRYKVIVDGVEFQPCVASGNKKAAKADAALSCLHQVASLPHIAPGLCVPRPPPALTENPVDPIAQPSHRFPTPSRPDFGDQSQTLPFPDNSSGVQQQPNAQVNVDDTTRKLSSLVASDAAVSNSGEPSLLSGSSEPSKLNSGGISNAGCQQIQNLSDRTDASPRSLPQQSSLNVDISPVASGAVPPNRPFIRPVSRPTVLSTPRQQNPSNPRCLVGPRPLLSIPSAQSFNRAPLRAMCPRSSQSGITRPRFRMHPPAGTPLQPTYPQRLRFFRPRLCGPAPREIRPLMFANHMADTFVTDEQQFDDDVYDDYDVCDDSEQNEFCENWTFDAPNGPLGSANLWQNSTEAPEEFFDDSQVLSASDILFF